MNKSKKNPKNSSGTVISERKESSSEDLQLDDKQEKRDKRTKKNQLNENEEITDEDNEGIDEVQNFTDDEESNLDTQTSTDRKLQTSSYVKESKSTSPRQLQGSFSSEKQRRSSISEQKQNPSSPKALLSNNHVKIVAVAVLAAVISILLVKSASDSSSTDIDWRLKVDPNNSLSNDQRNMIRASLKPILEKSSTYEKDIGVSTLLILSPEEESAAKVARCVLPILNRKEDINQISTEINLHSLQGGKLQLDIKLQTLFNKSDDIRAVLLRSIDNIPSKDTLDQLRLLFAYCDGENPVYPHRLIIMTAASISENENELREKYKTRLPDQHDFIDALMSRISGHALYVDKDQKSIC